MTSLWSTVTRLRLLNAKMASNDVTDIELSEIAEEIGHGIDRLGVHLLVGHTWSWVKIYQLSNRARSLSGTMEMLHSWRRMQSTRNKREVLVSSLKHSNLDELAERVQKGNLFIQLSVYNDYTVLAIKMNKRTLAIWVGRPFIDHVA